MAEKAGVQMKKLIIILILLWPIAGWADETIYPDPKGVELGLLWCHWEGKSVIIAWRGDESKLNRYVKEGWLIDRITGPFGPSKGITNYTVWIRRQVCE